MDRVNAYLCTEAMSIFVLDDSGNDLVARYAAGAASQEVIGVRLAPGQGVIGWVVQYGEDLIVPSTDLDPRFYSGVDERTGFTTRSILCVPLLQDEQARGAMEVLNKTTGHFSDDDVLLLQQVADLVADYVVTGARGAASAVNRERGAQQRKELPMQQTIEYFEERGRVNTERTLELACQRAREAGIASVVLASTRGYTAGQALEICSGLNLIAVGIGRERFPEEQARRFQETGKLIFSREVDYDYPADMQRAFRRFGQGTKVAVEVVVCAVLAGLVQEGERVIGVGGSGQGADTALLIKASWDFSDIHVSEILCKPA
jgi:putative methionine-R-sulfoxide reductase with GAF domain